MSGNSSPVDKRITYEVGHQLLEEAIDRASGRKYGYWTGRPEQDFYVANLSPGFNAEGDQADDGPFSQSRPSMVGLRFQPARNYTEFSVTVSFDVYLRVLPPLEAIPIRDRKLKVADLEDNDRFFVKVPVETTAEVDLETDLDEASNYLTENVQSALDSALETTQCEHVLVPKDGIDELETLRDLDDPVSEAEYDQLIEEAEQATQLEQSWEIECTISERNRDRPQPEITIELHNNSREEYQGQCSFLFNQQITVQGGFKRYRFRSVPEDYRYSRELWGKGLNASAESTIDQEEQRESTGQLKTTQVPSHQTYRFEHREYSEEEDSHGEDNHTGFQQLLSENTIDHLEAIYRDMDAYLQTIRGPRRDEFTSNLTAEEEEEFDKALRQFQNEIDNFDTGIAVLRDHEDSALRAFRLMNKTFKQEVDEDDFDSWYPFQLIFIVSNIPAIVDRMDESTVEEPRHEEAEVLWFPTGGGKTEAYLGLIVFNLFFDRIRGKEQGVTAWIRFPLTLLGEQQMSRFLDKLVVANQIREEEEIDGSEFDIGYFVGGQTTPNQIEKSGTGYANDYYEAFEQDHDTLKEECQVVDSCPRCDGNVTVDYIQQGNSKHDGNRVIHKCTDSENENCDVGELPIFVTDYEIYRYVPSVLLGTLDKIAITGTNPRFANLIGNHTTKCPEHGYGYSGKCSEANSLNCNAKLEDIGPEFEDPIPTLHLVDEVHLLNEELGVFASHYETMYLELCREFADETPKVITSTATISDKEGVTDKPAYDRLMNGLFLRDANRFPEEGPSVDESFYGKVQKEEEDKKLRQFYGITPNNKTHIYAVLDLVKLYQQVIRDSRSDPSLLDVSASQEDIDQILLFYELSIVYFLRKSEKDRFTRSIQSQINRELTQEDGYNTDEKIRTDELTGDVKSGNLLTQFENRDEREFKDRSDLITATSFISHGIDVDEFNSMFFFGFPRRTFEYIQSSSRVGREYPGFVVDMFLPFDNRDRHRFKYFEKTHQYLDRTVEETSVARWSRFSLNKTFPGLFKSILLQYFRPLMHRKYDVNVQSSRELTDVLHNEAHYPEFTQDTFRAVIERAYGVGGNINSDERRFFKREVDDRVSRYWQYWLDHLNEEYYTTFREEPMRSLRDIGEQITISPDKDQEKLFNSLTGEDN